MTRILATALLTPLLALALCGAGQAAPYGGAALSDAPAGASQMAGFRVSRPDLIAAPGGLRVHGAICRTGSGAERAPGAVRVERLDGAGQVSGVAGGAVSRDLSGRGGGGCAFYDAPTAWTLAAADHIRVCAVLPGRTDCAG